MIPQWRFLLRYVLVVLFLSCVGSFAEEKKPTPEMSSEMRQLLEHIQNQWMNKKPGVWVSDLYGCDIVWEDRLSGMRNPVRYSRRIRQTPDLDFLIAENWQILPGDLEAFMKHWGLNQIKDWGQFEFEQGRSRIFAVPQEGLLCIWRFFPTFEKAWKTPPYSLGKLSVKELRAGEQPEKEHRVKSFFSDVLLEEILDRDGLGISLSKTWHVTDDVSRFTTKIRLQRRLRLNVNGLYSVFDTFHIGGEALLGNVIEKQERHFYSEIGPFLGINKEITVIQTGYKTWYDALFSPSFNPRRLPYNEENIRKLPLGIRVIFPHEATLALIAKTRFNYFEKSNITQKLQAGLSVKGTVMVSLRRTSEDKVVLKLGGRLEKLLDAYFDLSPDFDGNLDPWRLLFGSIIKLRFESGRGKRVYLEKEVHLDSPKEVALLKKALKNGMFLSGWGSGLRTALYFIFHPNQENPQDYFKEKIPEIKWDQALIGTYQTRESYFKFGSRPISFRRGAEMISDTWRIHDYLTNEERSGLSLSIASNSNQRWVNGSRKRDLQIYGIVNDAYPDDVMISLVDVTQDVHWTMRELVEFEENWSYRLGVELDFTPEEKSMLTNHRARLGFRLLVSMNALQHLLGTGELTAHLNSRNKLNQWLLKHRVISFNLRRALRTTNEFLLARTIYKMIKKSAPIETLFRILDESQYRLEWQVEAPTCNLRRQNHRGFAQISKRQVLDWNSWQEKQAFEEIFVDVSLTTER